MAETKPCAPRRKSTRSARTLRERMKTLLALPAADGQAYDDAVELGVPPAQLDNKQLVVVALFKKAVGGDLSAIKELRAWVDEDVVNDVDGIVVELGKEAGELAN